MAEALVAGLVILGVFCLPPLIGEVVDYIIDVRHCAQVRRGFARSAYAILKRGGPLDQETIDYWKKACK